MNAFVNVKQLQEQKVSDDFVPEWPEILERQQALETPVWVEEWLNAAHQPTCVQAEESDVETWLEIAEHQQPINAPVWQAEWLAWADNRPVAASSDTACSFYSTKTPGALVMDRNGAIRPIKQLANDYLEIAA